MNCNIIITADIHPTEDPEKVKIAINNLFSPSSFTVMDTQGLQQLTATITQQSDLHTFYTRIREERILSAARRWLRQNLHDTTFTFCLHKQAAYSNRISFCAPNGESPLGPIRISISCDNPQAFIDWLTPRTTNK
jgi:predicted RNA binding protein with dsRBD fold (UPF0201 family)